MLAVVVVVVVCPMLLDTPNLTDANPPVHWQSVTTSFDTKVLTWWRLVAAGGSLFTQFPFAVVSPRRGEKREERSEKCRIGKRRQK